MLRKMSCRLHTSVTLLSGKDEVWIIDVHTEKCMEAYRVIALYIHLSKLFKQNFYLTLLKSLKIK